MVYENYKVYGPYLNKKDNRLRCNLVFKNKMKIISYPKYLMEVYLDRYLDKDETVDHIDGNPLNNDINNLRILKRKIHCYNDAYRNKDLKVKCRMCRKEFIVKGSRLNDRNRHNSGYFCSKQCTGKYGALIQNGEIKKEYKPKITSDKYQVRSALEEIRDVEAG